MGVVIETMNRLSEATDASLGRISELEEMRQAVAELKTHLEQKSANEMRRAVEEMKAYLAQQANVGAFGPRGDGGGHPGTRPDDDRPLINPEDMKVREFDGDKGFSGFIEDTKAYFEVVKPMLALAVEWIEYQPGILEGAEAKFGESADRYGRMLHGWMRQAQGHGQDLGKRQGSEPWLTDMERHAEQI